MPSFATAADKATTRAIEEWRDIVRDEVEDIREWRGNPGEKGWHNPWNPPPPSLRLNTSHVVSVLANDYPSLDPKPVMDMVRTIELWHEDRSADRLHPQTEIDAKADTALTILEAVYAGIFKRVRHTEPKGRLATVGDVVEHLRRAEAFVREYRDPAQRRHDGSPRGSRWDAIHAIGGVMIDAAKAGILSGEWEELRRAVAPADTIQTGEHVVAWLVERRGVKDTDNPVDLLARVVDAMGGAPKPAPATVVELTQGAWAKLAGCDKSTASRLAEKGVAMTEATAKEYQQKAENRAAVGKGRIAKPKSTTIDGWRCLDCQHEGEGKPPRRCPKGCNSAVVPAKLRRG